MTQQAILEPPADFPGTRPEWAVWWALTKLGYDFDYQSSQMGGRQERGGAILDFYLPEYNLGINIQSLYWHYGRPEGLRNDRLQREMMESMGIRITYIDEEDAIANPIYFVKEAIKGNDFSRMSRGI